MKTLVQIGVVGLLVYFVVSAGRPWLENLAGGAGLGPLGGGGSAAARCVAVAEDAAQHFGETVVRSLRPPIDYDRWSSGRSMAEGRVRQARDACRCSELTESNEREACDLATRALDELDSFIRWVDDGLRTPENPPVNTARRQEAVYALLDQARTHL